MILRTTLGISFLFALAFGQVAQPHNDSRKIKADSLRSLGGGYLKAGKYDSAQVVFDSEVKLRDELFDSLGLANSLNKLSEAFWRGGKYKEGLETAERGLQIIKMTIGENDTLAARAFNNIGNVYYRRADYKKALENFNGALSIRLKTLGPDHSDVAASYNTIGAVYYSLGDYEKALENYNKALSIRIKALGPDHSDVAASYNNIGMVYWHLGDQEKALENYNKTLKIQLKTLGPEHPDVARSYNNIGNVFRDLGDYEKALENLNKALAIKLKILGPEHQEVAASYNSIGTVYYFLGDYEKALENHNKALAIRLKALGPEHSDVAASYNNIGDVFYSLGDYEKALENYNKALAIDLKILGPEHTNVARSYNNIGNVYRDLGDYNKALENYNGALSIQLKVLGPNHPDVAASYNNIGNAYSCLGDYKKALENYNGALAIRLKVLGPEHPDVAGSYANIGIVYWNLGDYKKALENYNEALSIRLKTLGPDHPDVAGSYGNIGFVYGKLGDYEKTLENFNKALTIELKTMGPEHPDVAESYFGIGKTLRAEKKLEEALEYLKKSIAITEKVRGGVNAEELKKTYTESVRERYEEIVTLLLEMGRPKEAFEYYERSKSKVLQYELQKQGIQIGTGELKKKFGAVRSLDRQVDVLQKQLIDEKSRPVPEQNKAKIENLTRILAQTKGEFFKLVTEIKKNRDYSWTVTFEPMQFASIQEDLPEGNKLVMYYSSKDKLYILVVSKEGYVAKSVEVSRTDLDSLVKQFRTVIGTAGLPSDQSTTQNTLLDNIVTTLYSYLILPIEDQVSSATELTFIPSGNLYYIPLGALAYEKDNKLRYLLEDKPVSYLTSAELFRYVERKTKKPSEQYDVLLVGNPTGADLPSALEEVKAIHTLYPRSGLYLGADAQKFQIEHKAPAYQILHLATHAYPNAENPWESYIYLAKGEEDNGRWMMEEVMGEKWHKMTLVTLSACETAIGGDQPGTEMESMARSFSIAGSPSIVATLWPVCDPSTKELMVNFYKNLKTMSKVEALRQAQLSLLKSQNYPHPFFWAPFILIGDWR